MNGWDRAVLDADGTVFTAKRVWSYDLTESGTYIEPLEAIRCLGY